MKRSRVRVRWEHGLHLRPAARLVQLARRFRSTLFLRAGGQCADLRNILAIISLCAAMGMTLDIEASGEDEEAAIQAVEQAFLLADGDPPRNDFRADQSIRNRPD